MSADPDYLIVLYSKYSPQCQTLLDLFVKHPVPFIKPVCVDNTAVRRQLFKSSRIRITTVPAVILVFPKKRVEKYEGGQVYNWILEQYTARLPASAVTTPTPAAPIQDIANVVVEAPPPPAPIEPQAEVVVDSNRKKTLQEVAADLQKSRSEIEANYQKHPPIPGAPVQVPEGAPSPLPLSSQNKSIAEIAAELQQAREVPT
jgi:hypothetical protein